MDRATTALGALAYGFIVISALKVLAGHGGHGEESQRDLARQAMDWPGGRWLMGAFGIAIVALGFYQFVYVAMGGHRLRIRMDRLPRPARLLAGLLAWAGFDFLGSVHHQVFAAVAIGTIAYGIFLWINGACFRFGRERPESSSAVSM
jgi:hypothetical protein